MGRGRSAKFTMREINARELIPALPSGRILGSSRSTPRVAATREASHGEGGLQADRGGRNPRKQGSAHKPGLKCQGACDLKCVPRPKILRGAVRSRSITISDADSHRPAALWDARTHERKTLRGEGVCPNSRHARAGGHPDHITAKGLA